MKKFIVTTTIYPKGEALEKFDSLKDWNLIVIGDKKTPDIKLDNGQFIPAEAQSSLGYKSFDHIPWSVIQRRNFGYLEAVKQGADIIASVDDDNIPFDGWGDDVVVGKNLTRKTISDDLVCDALFEHSNVTSSKLWHRGFPVQLLEQRSNRKESTSTATVEVQAGLWNGDPDVDAVCRLAGGPFDLKFSNTEFFVSNQTFSPFNTQNTFFSRRLAVPMCLPYNIGRMDDIWASYMTQRIMRELDTNVLYTGPTVYQSRNDHDLSKDLEKEVIGYRHTLEFLRRLNEIDLNSGTILEMYAAVVEGVSTLDFIEPEMTNFQRAWLEDMAKIL